MKEKLRLLSPALLIVALLTVACCLLTYESEYLWKVQELNLFLDTPLFLKQQMVVPGWFLTWLGTYLTEFFYHPWMGVAMLTVWWALLLLLMARTFRVPAKWSLVLLVPIAAILLMNVDLGYWIYYLKLRGQFFAATIGTTLAVASVWAFRLLPARFFARPIFMFVVTGVLFPLIGFYGLLAAILMAVLSWRLTDENLTRRVVTTVVALLTVVFWPLLYYNYVFCQTSIGNIFWAGLPIFIIDESYSAYYIPYYILSLSLVGLAAMYRVWCEGNVRKPLVWGACQVLLLVVVGVGVYHFWYKDYNFHKELRMQMCVENLDWEGVLREAAENKEEPTRSIVMMRNLALFRLERQGNEMYRYPAGAKASVTPIPVHMTQVVGRTIYYHYGQLNFCYRWCLEDGVEFGWRAEYLKYLVRCSLLNGEDRVARKYLALLKHTRYHREWAEDMEQYVGHRDRLLASKEFAPITHMMQSGDMLSSDNSLVEKYLMNQFIVWESADSVFKEQSLIAALWMKDIQTFWPRFFDYAKSHPGVHMPIHYQEAAYLYGHLEHGVDISRMPFDDRVKKSYDDFMAFAQQCKGMSEEQMRPLFYPRFGNTFYYEYFLVRNQKLY